MWEVEGFAAGGVWWRFQLKEELKCWRETDGQGHPAEWRHEKVNRKSAPRMEALPCRHPPARLGGGRVEVWGGSWRRGARFLCPARLRQTSNPSPPPWGWRQTEREDAEINFWFGKWKNDKKYIIKIHDSFIDCCFMTEPSADELKTYSINTSAFSVLWFDLQQTVKR